MGGCGRAAKLRQGENSWSATLSDIVRAVWDEVALLLGRVTDLVRGVAPRLLPRPAETNPT